MVFSILSKYLNQYKVATREKYKGKHEISGKQQFAKLTLFTIFITLLTICSILAAVDIWATKNLSSLYLVLFIIALFIPYVGDVLGIIIIVYWIISISSNSQLIRGVNKA